MKLIGEDIGHELDSLPKYEGYYKEGDIGELRLYVAETLSEDILGNLEHNIRSQGVVLTAPIIQEARIIVIKFQKAIAPLLIIAGAVGIVVVGIIGWQLWKEPLGIPWWVWIIGGGALAYLLLRKPVAKAAPYAIQAGKVYVTRKVAK